MHYPSAAHKPKLAVGDDAFDLVFHFIRRVTVEFGEEVGIRPVESVLRMGVQLVSHACQDVNDLAAVVLFVRQEPSGVRVLMRDYEHLNRLA